MAKTNAKQNGTESSGAKPDEFNPNEIVTDATVTIPLRVVYERCKDLFYGEPLSASVKKDAVLAINVRHVQKM